jgi:hypothetical protein
LNNRKPVILPGHAEDGRRSFCMLAVVLGFAGVLSLFLPFASGESPVSVVSRPEAFSGIWQIALPFFLAPLISAASMRWIFSGRLSTLENAVACLAGLGAVFLTLFVLFQAPRPATLRDWLASAAALIIILAGSPVIFRNWRSGMPLGLNAILSMQVAYLANGSLCLIAFWGEWQSGAYAAFLAALACTAQVAAICRGSGRLSE